MIYRGLDSRMVKNHSALFLAERVLEPQALSFPPALRGPPAPGEPAANLAVIAALASSHLERTIDPEIVIFGGWGWELRYGSGRRRPRRWGSAAGF